MESIVVGVTESAASRSALAWVADRCAARAAEIAIVHVGGDGAGVASPPSPELVHAERVLRAAAPGRTVTTHRLRGGVAASLAEASDGADLLVIGVEPGHPVRAALGGWLAARVVARAEPPVCLVPAGWVPRAGAVVIGWEDDVSSTEALDFAAREAQSASAQLRIVHAWRLSDPAIDGAAALLTPPDRLLEHHRVLLEAAVRSVRRRFPSLHIEEDLARADPASALLSHASHAAVIVIGTHRDPAVTGAFSGSVALGLPGRAGCPVVVVPSASFPPRGA